MIHYRFIARQIRGSHKQAVIFISCVALSLLILTSLGGFSSSVRQSMLKDARQLNGADILIHSHYPFSKAILRSVRQAVDDGTARSAMVNEFYSMARNPERGKAILSDLKVVEQGYPFYGEVILKSGRRFADVLTGGNIIVEQTLLDRLQAKVGERLRIGSAVLTIADIVLVEPDRPVSFFSFGPRIFISARDRQQLGLIGKGSRIHYNYLLQVPEAAKVDQLADKLAADAVAGQEEVRTFRTARSGVKRFLENFLFFLNLIGIFTLLLAGIGIQTSLRALLHESSYTIAIMKSLGGTGRFILTHFMLMIMALGAIGTVAGLLLSFFLQLGLPALFAGILPAHVTLTIAWKTVLEGLLLGTVVVALFSLLPLQRLREVKPAFLLRKEPVTVGRDMVSSSAVIMIGLFFGGLVVWQLEDVRTGIFFILGLAGLIALIGIISRSLLAVMRKVSPRSLALRQAFRGLFRPNNATLAVIITLATSLSVVLAIFLIDHNLRATFIDSYPPTLPNAYFLDIQPAQQERFAAILNQEARYYPVVRARLIAINNKPINREKERQRRSDNLAREFNLTYRDSLLEDEKMLEGKTLFGDSAARLQAMGEAPVSVLDTVAEIGNIRVGDLLIFKIQGIPLPARVTSLRTRTQSKVRPFFYFVFPEETLRDAPQTFFSAARLDKNHLMEVQNDLGEQLPGVSVIDIGSTIKVLARIMEKMSTIIQFFTAFSILAGLLIIVSSILATRLARVREAVYFKILGAQRWFIIQTLAWENAIIALICGLLAALVAHLGSWIVCRMVFAISYQPLLTPTLLMIGATLLLTMAVGLGASLSILRQRPAPYLRDEGTQ